MKTLYFDCFAGASGDMLLGALIDLGLDLATLEEELRKLAVEGYSLSAEKTLKQGVSARKFRVRLSPSPEPLHHHREEDSRREEDFPPAGGHGRSYARIREILEGASIPETPKARAISAFHRLGTIEAEIHGVGIEDIHFHEVGAVDSIIDITGYFLGLHMLGVERVVASPLPVGRGYVECAHGRMPVPAPATAKLLEGVPVAEGDLEGEALTPTGALLLRESAEFFGPVPAMTITGVGYGAGDREQPRVPNLVRAFLGESEPAPPRGGDRPPATIAVLEANVDDMRPELFPHVIERVLRAGALDAFSTPITGKKGRPAQLLTILCPLERQEALTRLLFRETSTLGVRHRRQRRTVAGRRWVEVDLPWGRVRVKQGIFEGGVVNLAPEYEDCKRLAEESGVPLKEVIEAAAARARQTPEGRLP